MISNARILKGHAPLAPRRVPAAVHEADLWGRERIAEAEDAARRIRAEAEREREGIRAAAAEAGRREGLARAAAAVARAAVERDRRLARAEREVAALALAVARKVLGRELAERGATVVELAARALEEARERREVVLRVSPADRDVLRDAAGALGAVLARARLEVREDPALDRGAVVVETEAGRIHGGFEAQLAELARALDEALPP